MARPKRIILVRHGESQANVNRTLHGHVPDHKIALTERGHKQAEKAGRKIAKELVIVGRTRATCPHIFIRAQFYLSPYLRTRQTFEGIIKGLKSTGQSFDISKYEDPRLREQEFGNYRSPDEYDKISGERDNFGTFFYRIPGGESGADVFDRLSGAMDTMHRDFQKEDFPENMVVVSHGLTIRLFLMRWFHWTVEEFEKLRNPRNCQFYILEQADNNKYQLLTEMLKYTEEETHRYLARYTETDQADLVADKADDKAADRAEDISYGNTRLSDS